MHIDDFSPQVEIEMARSTEEEKQSQLARLADFQRRNAEQAPLWLEKLQQTVIENGNVFAVLVDAARYCSLGQIASALYRVGGQYRRSMQAMRHASGLALRMTREACSADSSSWTSQPTTLRENRSSIK